MTMGGPFSGKSGHGHIDRSTGRNRRDNLHRDRSGGGPERRNGKIVRGGRLDFQRDRKTGRK